jgi:hypothetical protein
LDNTFSNYLGCVAASWWSLLSPKREYLSLGRSDYDQSYLGNPYALPAELRWSEAKSTRAGANQK